MPSFFVFPLLVLSNSVHSIILFSISFLFILYFRWLGEKYDGVRCIWNPIHKALYLIFLIILYYILFILFYFTLFILYYFTFLDMAGEEG